MRQTQTQSPDGRASIVSLNEWDRKTPANLAELEGTSLKGNATAQRVADSIRGCIDVREGYRGLEVESTSFVGWLDIGTLRIAIQPKLSGMPLATLLRYAYGLRDLRIIDETRAPTIRHGLHDLLIQMLTDEVEELIGRGLARRYIPLSGSLDRPRGKILIGELAKRGGITQARLPCLHFDRNVDWHLNQVLRAGLSLAVEMTNDRELRRRVHRLWKTLDAVWRMRQLGIDDIDRAERELTRLTQANVPALTIIRLLKSTYGIAFGQGGESIRMPGFLFDMNKFFQLLLSRFLRENLVAHRILDERSIRGMFVYSSNANPRRRTAPTPRPDYALFRGDELCGLLDAKYRDIWEEGLPADWLYQLSVYALASPSRKSVLLYPTMSEDAQDARIDIREPVVSGGELASVVLRPVLLPRLAELIHPDQALRLASERRRFADELIFAGIHGRIAMSGRAA